MKTLGGRNDHLPALDGLRGLAACIVIFSHVCFVEMWGVLLGAIAGQIGVMLFFALSGYLMGYLHLERPFFAVEIWNYSIHRGARVLPLFYAVVIFAVLSNHVGRLLGLPLYFYSSMGRVIYLLTLVKGGTSFGQFRSRFNSTSCLLPCGAHMPNLPA